MAKTCKHDVPLSQHCMQCSEAADSNARYMSPSKFPANAPSQDKLYKVVDAEYKLIMISTIEMIAKFFRLHPEALRRIPVDCKVIGHCNLFFSRPEFDYKLIRVLPYYE